MFLERDIMLTAKKAMKSLLDAGFISSFEIFKDDDHGFRSTIIEATSDKLHDVSNETYGKKSFLYFYCKDSSAAHELIRILQTAGGRPGKDWNGGPNKGNVEIQVSYFKGRRWWE